LNQIEIEVFMASPMTLDRLWSQWPTVAGMSTDPISAAEDVRAILADPSYVVPPAPAVPDSEYGTLAWLRSLVARFCDGDAHDRRRALVERDLTGLHPDRLRLAAAELTRRELAQQARGEQFDAMILARRVPLAVLATELGLAGNDVRRAVDAVITAAAGYPNPDAAWLGTNASIKQLVEALVRAGDLGPRDAELLANRIGLLMQACDATAGLIGNALINAFVVGDGDSVGVAAADELVAETISVDPPVLRTRRLSPAGEAVTLDISGCTFGAGRRPCPGADQATALAVGVLDAILPACELADQQVDYVPSPNLRVPARLLIFID
jgi:cytochrome P450